MEQEMLDLQRKRLSLQRSPPQKSGRKELSEGEDDMDVSEVGGERNACWMRREGC